MKFKYDDAVFTGTRDEIVSKVIRHLRLTHLVFDTINNEFVLGEEKVRADRITWSPTTQVIKDRLIKIAVDKIPDGGSFNYDNRVYFGTKAVILKNIKSRLEKDFKAKNATTFTCGEETAIYVLAVSIDLIDLHKQMIESEMKRLEHEIRL